MNLPEPGEIADDQLGVDFDLPPEPLPAGDAARFERTQVNDPEEGLS